MIPIFELRWLPKGALQLAAALLLVAPVHAQDGPFTVLRQFPVADTSAEFQLPLSRDVVLVARRALDAQGRHMGWDLSAVDRRVKDRRNFFYECLCGHGPRPHDYYAWHFVTGYYPAERLLPVYGYPLEVRVRCLDCEAVGKDGADARFVRGTVELSVRRLAASNPAQRRT